MKRLSFLASLALTAVLTFSTTLCSAQDSIQYQLVIRNSAGQLVTGKQVNMKFSLMSGEQTFYQETMPANTNQFGNINVMIGTGKALKGSMKDVPWSTMDISLKVEADTEGGEKFAELGTVPIAASPYAMYAATAGSNASNGSPKGDEALFEVCDRDGQPVFAVYNDGIVVYIDQNSADKAKRSGLVVTGRKATKEGETADYFSVTTEGTHIYVDEDDSNKAKRSGLIVHGRKATKDGDNTLNSYLTVDASGTHVFVDSAGDDKAKRSGLVVTGRKATKDGEPNKFLTIDANATQFYIDENDSDKAKRSGFVVTGRKATKDDDLADNAYFAVTADGTNVIVDNDDDKAKRSVLVITGRKATKAGSEVFAVDGDLTHVYIDDDDAKAKRSGLVVTGRKATKDGTDYIDIDANRANLVSQSINISAPGDDALAMQVSNDELFINNMAIDGELRHPRPLYEADRFTAYISDVCSIEDEDIWNLIENFYEEMGDEAEQEFRGKYNYIQLDALDLYNSEEYRNPWYFAANSLYYYDINDDYHEHNQEFTRLASIVDTTKGMVLPCRSNGIILFDKYNKEVENVSDAVVVVRADSYYDEGDYYTNLSVFPLKPLANHVLTFALINQPDDGQPSKYERYDVTLNSREAFTGFKFNMIIAYNSGFKFNGTITTSNGTVEKEFDDSQYNSSNRKLSTETFYGDTVILEAVTAPEGMVFDYWKKLSDGDDWTILYGGGLIYKSNPLKITATEQKSFFAPYFKEIPPIMVDGYSGNDETGDGVERPYKTLERALQHIVDEGNSTGTHTIKLSSWQGDIAVGSDMNGKSAGITIDLSESNSIDGTSDADHPIDINTTVPITITNMSHFARLSNDRIVNVAKNASLTLDNCLVCGRVFDDGSITGNASVGAAYVAGTLSLNNSQIRYFSAENGGGVYIANGGSLTLSSSTVEYCSADNGGGVYVATGGNIEIDDYSSISNNTANDNGGGVYFATVDDNSQITISGITENSANYGGGVYVAGGSLTISNDVYIYNNNATNGGGVYVKAGTFKLENGSISNSNSNSDEITNGGGVYVNTNATFEMSGGSINNNNATNGGGVYLKAKSGSAVSTFTMNGGYIYSNNSSFNNAKGNGVYMGSGSAFNISGGAQLYRYGSYNNVYLASGNTINVSSDLSNNYVAMIVPQTYLANTPVVTSGNTAQFSKFAIEKQTVINTFGAELPVEWTIDNNGQLQKAATGDNSTVDGALQGLFSVSDNKTVRFSKGNLQYLASEDEWSFADSQTDRGDYNGNINISADNTGWINRFGYGTSGWNSGAKQYQPYSSDNTTDYLQTSMTGSNANADWGVYNAISNGGNTHGMWRTLTADEWSYLFNGRGTTSDSQKKFGKARINFSGNSHALGVIIFPDNWTMTQQDFTAAGISFTPGASPTNNGKNGYETNTLTEEQWQLLEANGAVFLPALGYRYVEVMTDNVSGEQTKTIKIEHGSYNADGTYATGMEPPYGFYWTASGSNVQFTTSELTTNANYRHDYGMCVRLVADVSDNGSADTHAKIDLGLPSGKKWAAVNLGSSIKPETEAVYTQYGSSYLGKYGNKVKWGATDLNSTANPSLSKTYAAGDVLELEDDPAYANWGGYWRIPTDEDWKELWENCFWKCDGTNQTWKVYRTKDEYKKGVHRKTGDLSQSGDPSGAGNLAIPYSSSIYYWTSVAANGSYAKGVLFEKNNDYSFNTYCSRISEYYIRPVWVPITTTVFYVSPDGNDDSNDGTRANPFATIQQAASKMIDKYTSYTIFVDGELGGEQTLSGTIKARQIILRSGHKTDNISSSIAISTSTPVVVEKLAINTLTVGEDATVTLAGGTVVDNANVGGNFTLKLDATATNVTLQSNKTLTIDESFDFNSTGQITITPAEYTNGVPVLTLPGNGVTPTLSRFAVANALWTIDDNGKLKSSDTGGTNPTGSINGKFSVGDDKQVYFSQGNLQYQASSGTWRFAEHQYDYVGNDTKGNVYENGVKSNNANVSDTYTGWIDLFCWGTGDNPTKYDQFSDYSNFTEWGSNMDGSWRTLTNAEWAYLISREGKCACAQITIDGSTFNGLVLLPDNWSGQTLTPSTNNFPANQFNQNTWAEMQQNGAVFLPAAGGRGFDKSVQNLTTTGNYWSSETYDGTTNAYYFYFSSDYGTNTNQHNLFYCGYSVRLVKEANP